MSTYYRTPPQRRGVHHSAARKLGVAVEVVVAIAAVLAIIGGLIAWAVQYEYGSQADLTFKIQTVTSVASGSNGSGHQYQVYTSRGDVLANQDSLMHGKFDSSNVQAWLTAHQGQVVTCPTYGYRVFVLSSYKIILDGCKVAQPGSSINY